MTSNEVHTVVVLRLWERLIFWREYLCFLDEFEIEMINSLNIIPKDFNLTFDEEDQLVKNLVHFLGHRRRNKFVFPLLITLYSFVFTTGLTGNLCKKKYSSFFSFILFSDE